MSRRFFVGLTTIAVATAAFGSNAFAESLPITSPEYDAGVAASATELVKDVSDYRGYTDLKLDPTKPITFSNSTFTVTDSNPAYLTDVNIGEISFTAISEKLPGGSFSATIKLDAKIAGDCSVASGKYTVTKSSNILVKILFQQDLNRFGDKVVTAFVNGSDIKGKYCH